MKHNQFFLLSVMFLLILASCGKHDSTDLQIEKDVASEIEKEVIINAYFYSIKGDGSVTTRSSENAWKDGDAIGLFMKNEGIDLYQTALADNVKLITGGTYRFTYLEDNRVNFPFNKQMVDFISYYPYTTSLNDFNYAIDVSDQTSLPAIDLLYSNNAKGLNSEDEEVNLIFKHQLTKVVFTIVDNNSGLVLPGLTAQITNVNTKASFSLNNGKIHDEKESGSVTLNVDDTGTIFQAILLPDEDLTDNVLYISIGDVHFSYPLSSSKITSFDKSTKCEYKISLEGSNINGVSATIEDWTTVTDSIIVTEDGSAIVPEKGNDSSSPEVDEGENGVEDGGVTIVGDGTEANPYNITQAIEIANSQVRDQSERSVWVKGYIVGFYSNNFKISFENSIEQSASSKLALAFTPEEVDYKNTFRIDLDNYNIYEAITLTKNPNNFKKEVVFSGNIEYLNVSHEGDVHGMKSIRKAILNGEIYPKQK